MDFENICRACLGQGSMVSIFTAHELIGDIPVACTEMLLASATVTVSKDDGFPKQICEVCYKTLCAAYKFRRLCEDSFTHLLDYRSKVVSNGGIKEERDDACYSNTEIEVKDAIKDEEDSVKEENDCEDIDDNERAVSPLEDSLVKPLKLESEKALRRIERERRKVKRALREKLKSKKKKQKHQSELLNCSLCPKTFRWNYMLVAHQDSHIGIKRYFCKICGKSYRNEKDHTNMHRRGNNYKCETCSKCFNTKAKLALHIETHSADRERVVCGKDGCKKTFLSLVGLAKHWLSHTGLRNFICHLCSKSFIDKYQLEIHIRTHTNERPHSCCFCSKSFITSSARISHERWHTNTKNYHCDYCDKSFVSSSGRKRHLLIHSKEQQQSCRFCGKKFARCDNKKRHEIAMHGVSDSKNSLSTDAHC